MKLDVGCGGGGFKPNPRGDINVDINIPTKKVKNFIRCDAHYLPFRPNLFNKVFMYDVVEHLESPLKALREVYIVMSEKGMLKLGTPNALYILKVARAAKRGFYSPHEDHMATWGLPELRALLSKAGFKQISIKCVTYLDEPHKTIERVILFLCFFKALRHRQLLAEALK